MHRHAAGKAKFAPILSFVAVQVCLESLLLGNDIVKNLQMSHQTVATMLTFPAQMIESIPYIMLRMNNQAMIESVATFLARQCQGNGRRSENAEIKATGANSGCDMMEEGKGQREVAEGSASYMNLFLSSWCTSAQRQLGQWRTVRGFGKRSGIFSGKQLAAL